MINYSFYSSPIFRCYVVVFLLIITSCQTNPTKNVTDQGKKLAERYCQSCHQLPDPDLLPKITWEQHILPTMGAFYGIFSDQTPREMFLEGGLYARQLELLYPDEARISTKEWRDLKDYYLENSPLDLDSAKIDENLAAESIFSAMQPSISYPFPHTSLVRIDETRQLYFFAEAKESISIFNVINFQNQLVQSFEWDLPFSDMMMDGDDLILTVIGDLNPSDQARGQLVKFFYDPEAGKYTEVATILNQLQRPVHTQRADLDLDGLQDFLICEFGNMLGRLSWFQAVSEDRYRKVVLKELPGAIRTIIRDFDSNGYPDIMVLFAQGNESIRIFYNQGEGQFNEELLLQFPPSYGSAWFDLVDMNGDGLEDIIYTNGDNADYDPVLKPYHGIRIFNQQQDHSYAESFFYHLDGAYKVIAEDFNLDGAPDLAVTSFFPDFTQIPVESFLLLKNRSESNNYQFEVSGLPQNPLGRFLVMDYGDLDQDGDQDLILGSFIAFEAMGDTSGIINHWLQNGKSLTILKNNTK